MNRLSVLLVAVALVAASCGNSSSPDAPPSTLTTTSSPASTTAVQEETTTTAADPAFPVTVEAPNGPVTIDARPTRIVSISPTSTEVLFAIGAGSEVVAVDSLSNHPTEAPLTELSAFSPSVEAIATFDPDLVFLSFDPNGDVIPGLEALGIAVILHPTATDLADAFLQWEQTGAATGRSDEALALVRRVRQGIDDSLSAVPDSASDLTYYYELEPTYYSSTSSTFVGELLSGTMMTNIADPADVDGFGYPQLAAEFIVGSDPDVILLADTKCCGQSAATVAERPGWDTVAAVRTGAIVELDDDIASRWGPRIVVLVEDVVAAILALEAVDG
ncbi:MAG TPA: ABC transporter substrate-binding protein [Acidimicrobiia bacterium]|nr:ABC transporter substrate-binding protein [Acidimicrobiia bacterium]